MRRVTRYLAGAALVGAAMACTFSFPSPARSPSAATLTPSVGITEIQQPAVAPIAAQGDLAFLYEQAYPGVVTIWTFNDLGPGDQSSVPSGQGSGFVIDSEGHIVTNQHVVNLADEIEVDFPSGLRVWATLLGVDPDSDLAILKVDVPANELIPLPLGDSDLVMVGEQVVAIGNPFGLSGTMTVGVVSAVGRTLASEREAPTGAFFTAGGLIQTDAAINPGNSGGPLLNTRGEVIGVNRAIRTESFAVSGSAVSSGVGFAIPVNIVRRVAPAIISSGNYDYPYLGISSLSDQDLNLKILEQIDLPPDTVGAYVTCVTPGGPAERAGLRGAGRCNETVLRPGGDLIIAINELPIANFNELLSFLISETEVGQVIDLTVLREGREVNLTLTIGARP
jgi:S1-C subfamily serine protease